MGVNCEEKMREKKMRWVGEEKRKVGGYMGGGEKKNKNKKEKRNGEWGIRV
jgi:hypothetical protein